MRLGAWQHCKAANVLLGKALPDDAVNNLSDERHAAEDTTPE